ncbi:MAG: LAGLIDADG family homing endonuclease [Nitrososphaerota archaeon]
MNMVSMSISKEGERRRYLPLEIRIKMYEEVHELRKKGLTYKEVQERIYEKYGRRLSIAIIGFWINKKKHPLGRVNKFDENPSPEFTYIIGVISGDGCRYFYKRNYRLQLAVKDYEFAEKFGECLAKVLGRKRPYKPFWSKKLKQWIAQGYSFLLYKFLNKPLEELKPYIEHSKDTVSAFLKALFDAEGSIYVNEKHHVRELKLYNTNVGLLNYAKYLLKKYFNIDATGPHFNKKTKTTKNCYYLYIRTNTLSNFYDYIGFIIKRKQQRLIKAIER